ncbi:TetR/AcrR family transcriptional regulator [Nonomuraea muscovyensis]|uniref:AcrR family transcriptional regulator n=1 Tax=Nonomuraea muscovyensis TaxID=1124761 RepID=A0A7X0EYC1_9ACTN|nr:TetR/AcrR family transcriptional regulator [Nonomuraea muscovyensis]MBB6345650.1 AcrR family transcriptional regulator [Nonomuraea muscovyensis]
MAEVSAERGRATRERLLRAAVSLIGEVGWSGVSTRMVAQRAGVNAGVVHYHFASVSDLLVAAGVGFARELLEQAGAELARRPSVPDGIDWLLRELSRYSGTDPASLLMAELFLAAGREPGLRDELGVLIIGFRSRVAGWLRAHGHGAQAEQAAVVIAALMDGLVLHRALDPALDPTTLAGPLRAMLGVRPEGGSR